MTTRRLVTLAAVDAESPEAPPCACSRRELLRGLGSLAIGLPLLAGCSASGSQIPSASAQSCSGGLCLDLTSAANAALTQVGGALVVDAPSGDTIVVIRKASDAVVALSAVCTHRGCIIDFDASQQRFVCPCHGSEFAEDGSVVRGPAQRPLAKYGATLSGNQITIATG